MRMNPSAISLVAMMTLLPVIAVFPAMADQSYFAEPESAAKALVDASRSDDQSAVLAVLGPAAEELVNSGDSVADEAGRQRFVAAATVATRVEAQDADHGVVFIGPDEWPFPIPLIKEEAGWRFDTDAGKEELINRRIGKNELYAIATVRAVVDAQHEYADSDYAGDGSGQYAQRFASTEGKRDGLYWPVEEGQPQSPLGPLVAAAAEEGYSGDADGTLAPYHGFFYRLLTAQGGNAPGGAKSYLKEGRMSEGFALLAYPAEYGNSGVMTFIIDDRGLLFEKDLGPDTRSVAAAMNEYDPDASWRPVSDIED